MPPPSAEPLRITFSRRTWFAIVAVVAVQFGIFFAQLALQEDQRTSVDRQLAVAARQSSEAMPLLRETRPLVQDARSSLPAVRRLGRDTQALLGELTPLARDLRDARAPEQLQAAGALARTLLHADVGEMARALQRADLPRLATDVRAVSGELLREQRLRRLLVRSNGVLGEVRARHLVAKSSRAAESVPRMEELLRESVRIQRETLALARETTAAADRAARAAESIDRKTGPSLAPTSAR